MDMIKQYAPLMLGLSLLVAWVHAGQHRTDEGWRTLFNGENLNGWEFRGGGKELPTFDVEDGMVVGRTRIPRNSGAFLSTKEQFKDFELVFEVKIDEGLNSGVQVRSTLKGTMRGAQVEIESGSRKTGFIYGQGMGTWLSKNLPEKNRTFNKNQWNTFRVIARGSNIKTWVNGEPVADLTSDRIAPEGVIALQVHGYPRGKNYEQGSDKVLSVAWKNIKIREIDNKRKKDILFIAIDDLNDWPSSFDGYKGKAHTPNIDRLVNQGVKFVNSYTAATECCPSRNALFWGMRQTTTGYYQNGADPKPSEAMKKYPPLTAYFQQQGYEVKGAGKLYHGEPRWHKLYSSRTKHDPGVEQKMKRKNLNGLGGQYDWGAIDITREEMYDGRNAKYIANQIRKNHESPQFWLLGIFKPHEPWYLPQEYFDRYPLDEIKLPEIGQEAYEKLSDYAKDTYVGSGFIKTILPSGQWRQGVQAYLAATSLADDCLGEVLDALEESGKMDDTIIILWSDHGWHLGEKNHWRKTTLWQEATRNLLSIYVPAMTKPESVCYRTVDSMDLYPTICELAGTPVPRQLEGHSLVPLLKDPSIPWDYPAITIALPGDVNVRTEKWAYIRYSTGDEELYDMTKDPMQWKNLAANPECNSVKEQLKKFIPEHKANYFGVTKH